MDGGGVSDLREGLESPVELFQLPPILKIWYPYLPHEKLHWVEEAVLH